jgi:probable rRNA maturation factor
LAVKFFTEQISYNLKNRKVLKSWVQHVISLEEKNIGSINYIFSSDDFVLEINRKYLQHDYYTDIITFNYNEDDLLSGDIFISIDTVRTNAPQFSKSFNEELYRVIIHGVLHLVGYDDQDDVSRSIMRQKEDDYIQLLSSKFLLK